MKDRYCDGYNGGTITDQFLWPAIHEIWEDPVERKKLVQRLAATETREEQQRLLAALNAIGENLQADLLPDEEQLGQLEEIAATAGLEVSAVLRPDGLPPETAYHYFTE